MLHARISLSLAMLAFFGFVSGASAQVARTYYLRPPSTIQQGCFIGCACWTSLQEPLHGTFALAPSLPDPVFNNFTVTAVDFSAPTFATQLIGNGTYQIGGDPAALERMQLDLALNADPVQHWDSGYSTPTSGVGAINQVLTIHNYQCYDIVLTLHASPYRSDWNTDGVVDIQDIFSFINTWLAGDGDADGNGQTSVMDVFTFINDWFARQ
jgi:hypothetical protein